MNGKPRISPNDTFIFDDEDLEQLDQFSLTSVINEVSATFNTLGNEAESSDTADTNRLPHPEFAEYTLDEPSIDELLDMSHSGNDAGARNTSSEADIEDTGTYPAVEILIDPKEIFTDDDPEEL